jgi:hypothetical protein
MKVALIGTSPMSFDDAPWDDDTWEKWCLNDLHIVPRLKHWDRWFQVHPLDNLDFGDEVIHLDVHNEVRSNPEIHMKFLTEQTDKPVYVMPGDEDKIPTGVAIEKDEIIEEWGKAFLTSAVAWMFATAIRMEAEEIGLWGIDMALDTEYGEQRMGLRFFKWVAEKRGIKVIVPQESDMFLDPVPYPDLHPLLIKMDKRRLVFEKTRDKFKEEAAFCERNVVHFNGQLQTLNKYRENISDYADTFAELEKIRDEFGRKCEHATKEVVILNATIDELRHQARNLP